MNPPLPVLVACVLCPPMESGEAPPPPADPPSISGISPYEGWDGGGHTITITGTGFVDGATVLFGSTPADSVVFVSDTELTVVTPAHAAGAVNVTVTNPDTQSDVAENGFSFLVFALTLGTPTGAGIPFTCPSLASSPPGTTHFRLESSSNGVDWTPQASFANLGGEEAGTFNKAPDVDDGDPFSLGFENTLTYLRAVALSVTDDDLGATPAVSETTVAIPAAPAAPSGSTGPPGWVQWLTPAGLPDRATAFDLYSEGTVNPPTVLLQASAELASSYDSTNHAFGETVYGMMRARNIYGHTDGATANAQAGVEP